MRRQVSAGIVLVAYLFAMLGMPIALAAPAAASADSEATDTVTEQSAHACGCDTKDKCCCAPQPTSCTLPCCAPAKEAPRAPGLSLAPLSCRCTTSNLWIGVGSVLPVPQAASWQPYFAPIDWIGEADTGRTMTVQLPDVPPPRNAL